MRFKLSRKQEIIASRFMVLGMIIFFSGFPVKFELGYDTLSFIMIFFGLGLSSFLMFFSTFFSGLSHEERFSIGWGEVFNLK